MTGFNLNFKKMEKNDFNNYISSSLNSVLCKIMGKARRELSAGNKFVICDTRFYIVGL